MHKKGYTDVSLKVSQFLLKSAGIWVIGNNAEERQRKFAAFYTFAALIYGIYVNAVDIYHNLDNLAVSLKHEFIYKLEISNGLLIQ